MKKILLNALIILSANQLVAQVQTDTVSLGVGYANQKWYSLQNDEVQSAPKNNWDLAFDISGQGSAIHINTAMGMKLWVYPNGNSSAWSTLDTAGLSTWAPLYNSDTSWAIGAFNKNKSGNSYDLGWGIYNSINHFVDGDSLHVIKLANGSYKKLFMESLGNGTYTFKYADLSGANETTAQLAKSTYTGKNFGYYSIQNNTALDREPVSSSWDLLFSSYTAFIPQPYGVTGVLSNKGVKVAEAKPVDVSTVSWSSYTFKTPINEIGYNWKAFAGTWSIEDSLVYFVQDKGQNIWKLIFTGFGGSANGNFGFEKQKVSAVGISDLNNQPLATLAVYPNPSSNDNATVIYSFEKPVSTASLTIFDLSGKVILTENVSTGSGLNTFSLSNQNLSQGLYFISLNLDEQRITQKLIIK